MRLHLNMYHCSLFDVLFMRMNEWYKVEVIFVLLFNTYNCQRFVCSSICTPLCWLQYIYIVTLLLFVCVEGPFISFPLVEIGNCGQFWNRPHSLQALWMKMDYKCLYYVSADKKKPNLSNWSTNKIIQISHFIQSAENVCKVYNIKTN